MNSYLKIFSFIFCGQLLLACSISVFAQQKAPAKKAKQIELLNANSLEYDESLGTRAKRLIGNVALKHENTTMYCDSAYLFSDENRFDAFGHIHIKPQGTSDLYGDSLKYYGNTKIANIRGAVRLVDKEHTLTTNAMDYNIETDLAFYMNGGTIVNSADNSTLKSVFGYFYPQQNEFFFKNNVEVVHPDYVINSDTLKYNTETKITSFLGPSTIKSKDSFIYCENGLHDSQNNISRFGKNAYMKNDKQKLTGDSIIYDRGLSIGRVIGNVMVEDSTDDLIINGDLLLYYEKDSISIVTGKAMLTQYDDMDTLFLHADTLVSKYEDPKTSLAKAEEKIPPSGDPNEKKGKKEKKPGKPGNEVPEVRSDTIEADTVKKRIMIAFHKVKFYKTDMQGKCDSLVFADADSAIKMFRQPVIWSNENQMTADYIEISTYAGAVHSMLFDQNAFIISEVKPDSFPGIDSLARFNQIKGEKMVGHFDSSKLVLIDVLDKGETVYYAMEEKKSPKKSLDSVAVDSLSGDSLKTPVAETEEDIIGVNIADCDSMVIHVKDNKVQKITFRGNIKAALHPVDEIPYQETLLEGFSWKSKLRPLRKEDIFVEVKE